MARTLMIDTIRGGGRTFKVNEELKVNKKVEYVVRFRRTSTYGGEFGFDWMRKDYLEGTCVEGLEDLKQIYTPFEMNAHDERGEPYGDYYVPWLTMFPNHKDKIGKEVELLIEVEHKFVSNDVDETEEFRLVAGNSNLRVVPDKFNLFENFNGTKVTVFCDDVLEEDTVIEVKSSQGGIVGKLNVMKNAGHENYTINIPVVFAYITDKGPDFDQSVIENAVNQLGGLQAIEDYLNRQSLNQALIQVKFVFPNNKPYNWGFRKVSLTNANNGENPDGSGRNLKYREFRGMVTNHDPLTFKSVRIMHFFHRQFGKQYASIVNRDKGIILYLTSLTAEASGGASQVSPLYNKNCIIYKPNLGKLSTYAHEIAHTLGVMHSFPETEFADKEDFLNRGARRNQNIYQSWLSENNQWVNDNPNDETVIYTKERLQYWNDIEQGYQAVFGYDKYKFEKSETDNFLDYQNTRKAFYKWQIKIMQNEAEQYYH